MILSKIQSYFGKPSEKSQKFLTNYPYQAGGKITHELFVFIGVRE